jgi:tRNA (guanine37-N1)-methyltransferase
MSKSRVPGPGSRAKAKKSRGGSRAQTPKSEPSTRDAAPGRPKPGQIPTEDQLIGVGVIRKAHGIKGEASVEPLTDSVERLAELTDIYLVSPDRKSIRTARIDGTRFHGPRALIHLEGMDSPEQVRDLQSWSIEIAENQLRKLGEREYFIHDLIGLEVVDSNGKLLGETAEAQEGASGVLLTVRTADDRTFEMPFVAAICLEVDTDRKRMVVDLPAGLTDLDRVTAVEDELATAETASLRIDIVTIFPRMFEAFLDEGVIAKACKNHLLRVKIWDLRTFTADKHRSTDDEAYGGGSGMVMLAEPIFRCLEAIRSEKDGEPWVVLMSPQGQRFDHGVAEELAGKHWIVILCGRYEGIDERVREALVNQELSVGDFVVSGGEVPAILVVDAVARMVEGVVGDWNSVRDDSFYNGLLDHPHYSRPADLRGLRVPEVLLSGHAENIRKWRKEQSLRATLNKRPDLLEKADLDDEARQMLEKIKSRQ